MRRFLALLLPAVLLVACSGGGQSVPVPPSSASFDSRLDAAFTELERSGAAVLVGVSHADGPVVVREFGAAATDAVPAEDTQIDLNSITKTVTGVMVMRLAEQGAVRLDETLAEILPAVPEDKAAITVHQLLTHSAGFVNSIGDDAEVLSREEYLQRALTTELMARPGEEYHYSNVGYSLLAAIIEQRSGSDYETYLQRDVLGVADLDQIGYASVYDEARSLRTDDGQPIREASWGGHDPSWNLIGNGGLVATPEAFIRFRQAVVANQILSQPSLERLQTPHVAEDEASTSHYGYGLVVQDDPGPGRSYWHDGGNDVYSAEWADYVDQGDVLFTAAVDSTSGDAFSAMATLRRYLYGMEEG